MAALKLRPTSKISKRSQVSVLEAVKKLLKINYVLRERFLESVIRNGGRLGVGLVGGNQGGRVLQKSAADDLLAAQPPPPPLTHSSSQDSQNTNLKYRTEILSPTKILVPI